jgi:hypothetical protein
MKRIDVRKVSLVLVSAGALAINASGGTYANITIDGSFSDWAGVPVAYADEDGVNNPGNIDFQNVYLANDSNYLYIRFTLMQPADPISDGNTFIWLDGDTNPATGFHPFGNPNFGASLMIIADQAYQETGGGFNEGTLANADVAYGADSLPGTDFEFRIALNVTGVSGASAGVPLLPNSTIGVQLATQDGNGDSLPDFSNYGALTYTLATVPEPGTLTLVGFGLLMAIGFVRARKSR